MQQQAEPTNEPKPDVSIVKSFNVKYQQDISTSSGLRKRTSAHSVTNKHNTTNTKLKRSPKSNTTKNYPKYKQFLDETYCTKHVSDSESENNFTSKKIEYKNQENSQIICYRDKDKIIAIKNDSTTTKYNSVECVRSKELVKFHKDNLDKIVKYRDPSKDDKKKKSDIIRDTVDAWARKNSKSMLSNLRDSIFGNGTDKMTFKPLVFGGTYPIDIPTNLEIRKSNKGYTSDVDTSSSSEMVSENVNSHRKRH